MTKRPLSNLSVLAIAVSAVVVLAACGPKVDEAAKKESEGHAKEFSHITAKSGDAARGEKLAKEKIAGRQSCIECHGEKGNAPSADMAAPVLAGQYQDYLFHSLQMYREGTRENALMTSHAKALDEAGKFDDQTLADLSAYFATQSSDLGDLHGTH
jgi:cytochrome c553